MRSNMLQMNLAGASADELSSTKTAYDSFLADPARLAAVRKQMEADGVTPEQKHVLAIMEKTFKVGMMANSQTAKRLNI